MTEQGACVCYPRVDLQVVEERTTREETHMIATSLEFLSSFLGVSSTALECTVLPTARFLFEALAGHQVAELHDTEERH